MPSNTEYLQAAFAVTVLSFAVYIAYALIRLRQAQDELRGLLERRSERPAMDSAEAQPAAAGPAEPPPAPTGRH